MNFSCGFNVGLDGTAFETAQTSSDGF